MYQGLIDFPLYVSQLFFHEVDYDDTLQDSHPRQLSSQALLILFDQKYANLLNSEFLIQEQNLQAKNLPENLLQELIKPKLKRQSRTTTKGAFKLLKF